jgi:hypothetical protein
MVIVVVALVLEVEQVLVVVVDFVNLFVLIKHL